MGTDEGTEVVLSESVDRIEAAAEVMPDFEVESILEFDSEEEQVEEEKKEPEPEPEPKPEAHEFAALRRQTKKLREKEQAFEAKLDEWDRRMSAREQELQAGMERYAKLQALEKEDPEAFLKELGRDPDAHFEHMQNRRLMGGKVSAEEVMEEVRSLRQQLAERDVEREREDSRRMQERQERELYEHIEFAVKQGVTGQVKTAEGLRDVSAEFPHLFDLPPERREGFVRQGVIDCMKNRPGQVTVPQLLKALDSMVAEEQAYIEQRRVARGQGTPADSRNPEGKREPGNPAANAEDNEVMRTSLSNVDQSASSPNRRRLEREDRIAAAARAIPDDLFG